MRALKKHASRVGTPKFVAATYDNGRASKPELYEAYSYTTAGGQMLASNPVLVEGVAKEDGGKFVVEANNESREVAAYTFYNSDIASFSSDSVEVVNSNAFSGCSSLSSFEAPNLTYVGNQVFYDVAQSTANGCDFYFDNETPAQIESNTFDSARINHIYVPASVVDTYKAATNWSNYSSYITAIP